MRGPRAVIGRHGPLVGKHVVVLGTEGDHRLDGNHEPGLYLRTATADVVVEDPMYEDEELAAFGWDPYHVGEDVDVVIVQADHKSYADLSPRDFPGIKLLFDGRRITNPDNWVGTPRLVIGE